jgi:uncharacterized protein YwbE
MDNFEKYVREMVAQMEIVNDIAQETGKLNGEAIKLLMTKAIEPYGLWKGSQDQGKTNGDATTDSGLMSIVSKYGMIIDGVKIKIVKKVEDFKGLCNEMEKHGYEYMKGKSMFVPKWQGVRQ